MVDNILALMTSFLAIFAGTLYLRNATRMFYQMDIRKRSIRIFKGAVYIAIGVFYLSVVLHLVPVPSMAGALIARMLFVLLFATAAAYAIIEL